MLLSFIYLAFVSLLKLLVRSHRSVQVKDIELIVLRHQLEVLRRQVERPTLRSTDRAFLAAASRLLPPASRHGLLVTPQTLLRWQKGPTLASVREPAALAGLPPEEQAGWRRVWAEVERLLQELGREAP